MSSGSATASRCSTESRAAAGGVAAQCLAPLPLAGLPALRVERSEHAVSPVTTSSGEVFRAPMAHGDGNYFADDATLDRLEGENLVAFRYDGPNPNGSARAIAGIVLAQSARARPDAASGGSGRPADGRHRRAAVVPGHGRGRSRHDRHVQDRRRRALPAASGFSADEYDKVLAIMGRTPSLTELGIFSRHVVGALLLQIQPRLAQEAADDRAMGHSRTRRECWESSTSARGSPPSSRWRATITPASSSRIRVPPPASAASSAMSSPWARARSPT